MLKLSLPAFLAIPNQDNKRVLNEGKVKSLEPGRCQIEFDQVAGLAAGTEVMLFAETKGKFFQQAAVVIDQTGLNNLTTISFDLIGDAVSAEQRGNFRTSAVTLNLPVQIDRLAGCTLADVSPEGMGVISPKPLTVGSTVDVSFMLDGFSIQDKMKVLCFKTLPSGKLRCGLYVPNKTSQSRRTLEKMAGHLQRVQLRRLSGAA